ncbi:Uncharacterised protein [Raoultella planticola]|nr:Uncharacterised protein [Raoultella planticola]
MELILILSFMHILMHLHLVVKGHLAQKAKNLRSIFGESLIHQDFHHRENTALIVILAIFI